MPNNDERKCPNYVIKLRANALILPKGVQVSKFVSKVFPCLVHTLLLITYQITGGRTNNEKPGQKIMLSKVITDQTNMISCALLTHYHN